MTKILILLHVTAGSIAVGGMILAWLCEKGGLWHRRGGKAFIWGMLVSLVLATVVSILTRNVFLLFIGFFSAYFVYTGWRLAVVRNGKMNAVDRAAILAMFAVSVLMGAYGIFMLTGNDTMGVVLIVFAFVAAGPALQDFRLKGAWPRGSERIVLHLNRMGGATIAALTAVAVTNIQTNPGFIGWLAPGVLFTPLIIYWTRRTRRPAKPVTDNV